jgi:hypothetical protein
MEKLRLSLAVPTEPRSSEYLDKDSCVTNAFIDIDPIQNAYIVKRPGTVLEEAVSVGTSRGIFYHNNTLYYVTSTAGIGKIT